MLHVVYCYVVLVMLVQLALLVLPHVLRYAEVCRDMLRICWDMLDRLGYVRICWDMLGFAGTC